MPKDTEPKTPIKAAIVPRGIRISDMPSDTFYCEQIRSALPDIAAPIKPGELLAVWIERAARQTGISAARLRAYWHRKVECPRIPEYIAILGAAEEAARRRQAIADLESSISKRQEELRSAHDRLARSHPVLAFLAPRPLGEMAAGENPPQVKRRRAGGER